jgi:phospholipase C
MKFRLIAALMLAAVLGLLAGSASSDRAAAAGTPCGTLARSSVDYTHVIWIWMENHSYDAIIGSPEAPYTNSLAGQCGLATNYHNISHPSLPNYIAATSGLSLSAIKKFKSDCSPSKHCSTDAPAIFGQTSWKAYEESMTSNCELNNDGEYAVRHNPPPYFTSLTDCGANDVPYTELGTDLANGTLAAFSFVTPNLIDDTHDGTIKQGDDWLAANVPTILNSAAYQAGNVALFITYDEGEGGKSKDCATNTTDIGCHVATLVVTPSTVAGTTSGTLFNHYSLLGTTEQLLGLPALGEAANAGSLLTDFNL